jgi:bacterioferritin comigratory protein
MRYTAKYGKLSIKESEAAFMAELTIGAPAPDFTLPSDGGNEISLSDYRGKKVILYFYPKDSTSGCTMEAQAFRDHKEDFQALGYEILGISRDSVRRHCNFRDKNELNFPLLADTEETVCQLYGVMKEKSMYGRKYMGIERSTFLIDEEGRLTEEFRNVKASKHVDELLSHLRGE